MALRLIDAGGARFTVADGKDGFWDRLEAGDWEPETLAAVRRLARPGMVLVDIGGWIGPITLTAAALGAGVLVFEPDPRAFELLSLNIAANPAFAARIAAHNLAVAPQAGRLRFGSPRKPGDSMGSVLLAESGVATWEADAIAPADVAALAGPRLRVLKIDIEGGEYALLPRLAPLLDADTTAALVALHPRILAAAGEGPERIRTLTEAALAAFEGFSALRLEGAGAPEVENSTVLFERQ